MNLRQACEFMGKTIKLAKHDIDKCRCDEIEDRGDSEYCGTCEYGANDYFEVPIEFRGLFNFGLNKILPENIDLLNIPLESKDALKNSDFYYNWLAEQNKYYIKLIENIDFIDLINIFKIEELSFFKDMFRIAKNKINFFFKHGKSCRLHNASREFGIQLTYPVIENNTLILRDFEIKIKEDNKRHFSECEVKEKSIFLVEKLKEEIKKCENELNLLSSIDNTSIPIIFICVFCIKSNGGSTQRAINKIENLKKTIGGFRRCGSRNYPTIEGEIKNIKIYYDLYLEEIGCENIKMYNWLTE